VVSRSNPHQWREPGCLTPSGTVAVNFCEFHFYSTTLGMQTAMNVLLPDTIEPPFATLYLLHGLSDDHTAWMRRSRIEVYAEKHQLAIVMPNGYRGFYTNNEDGPAYADYIVRDVMGVAEKYFPLKRDRAHRAIGGLSMGGYGALRIALSHPQLFISAHSHSGAVLYPNVGAGSQSSMTLREHRQIFGPTPIGTSHDLLHLAKKLNDSDRPFIHLDCGREDFLFEQNERFHAELGAANIPHEYQVHTGVHDWDYWDIQIQKALAFHATKLKQT
jgi:putative tributyrin esterase